MVSMHEEFGIPVGYSDHSEGIIVPVAAASLSAVLIEKHFTLNKTLPVQIIRHLEPDELAEMVHAIRVVEQIMGDGQNPSSSELKNRDIARKKSCGIQSLACRRNL